MTDDPKSRGKLASADTLPVSGRPVRTPGGGLLDPAKARYTISDTMPIPEVPEPSLPDAHSRISVMPSGMHERGKLGRFDILDILGQGGMGVVVAAYDPQLDRKVAIKVLRTRGLTGKRRDKEAARLLREARTMAQLSHPHVVTVYEAGEIDDRVYIAMEYIPGQTLRSWLDEKPRTVLELLDAYIKAGRGLSAGHLAGLIHRDFKPDNVLVGFDGRVRVIDFGLARPTRGQHDTPSPLDESSELTDPDPESRMSSLHLQLTTAGSLFGTPIYMSPEQHNKLRLDGHSDQFSFCVALYEALYQALPFEGGSYAELASNVTEGKVRPPPERPDIPKRVVDAILRGLRVEPEERFPTMDALLDELSPPAKQLNRSLLIGLAGIAAVAIALVVVLLASRESAPEQGPPCEDGPDRLATVWNDPIKNQIKTAFLATGRSYAEATYRRIAELLDAYSSSWIDDRRKVCEATMVHNEQSLPLFDLRMQCATDRLTELAALTKGLAAADAGVVDRSSSAIRNLRSSTNCVTLTSNVAPPTVNQAARLEKLRAGYYEAKANNLLGRYDIGAKQARVVLDQAADLDYPPFTVAVQHALGFALAGTSRWAEAEKELRGALVLAARAKNDRMVATIWISLITVIGNDAKRYDEALALRQIAEIAIKRADDEVTLRSELYYGLGVVILAKGDYEQAVKILEAGLALPVTIREEATVASFENALGLAHLRVSNIFGAREAFKKALAASRLAFSDGHPDLAIPLSSLGALAQAMGNWDEATSYHGQALKIIEETRGPEHEQTGLLVYSLALSSNGREDFKAALPLYQRALAIFEKVSLQHPYVGLALIGIADCLEELGDPTQAVAVGERALKLMASAIDPVQLAMARFILAKALWAANVEKPRARKLAMEAHESFKAGGFGALMGYAAVEKWLAKIDGKK
jgi:eukaryotic-like serine/threonine-protein kinase